MSRRRIPHFVDPKGIVLYDSGGYGLLGAGNTVPTDGAANFQVGCLWIDTNAADGSQLLRNDGTTASCDFNLVTGGIDLSTLVTTAAELNLLSGLLATAAELNRATDLSTRIVNTTATQLAITLASHSDKIITVNSAAPIAMTLPAATGTGAKFTIIINTAATGTAHTLAAASGEVLKGAAHVASSTTDKVDSFLTTATDLKLSLNGTTKGGAGGDRIEVIDCATSLWNITAWLCGTGTIETGFSSS